MRASDHAMPIARGLSFAAFSRYGAAERKSPAAMNCCAIWSTGKAQAGVSLAAVSNADCASFSGPDDRVPLRARYKNRQNTGRFRAIVLRFRQPA